MIMSCDGTDEALAQMEASRSKMQSAGCDAFAQSTDAANNTGSKVSSHQSRPFGSSIIGILRKEQHANSQGAFWHSAFAGQLIGSFRQLERF